MRIRRPSSGGRDLLAKRLRLDTVETLRLGAKIDHGHKGPRPRPARPCPPHTVVRQPLLTAERLLVELAEAQNAQRRRTCYFLFFLAVRRPHKLFLLAKGLKWRRRPLA